MLGIVLAVVFAVVFSVDLLSFVFVTAIDLPVSKGSTKTSIMVLNGCVVVMRIESYPIDQAGFVGAMNNWVLDERFTVARIMPDSTLLGFGYDSGDRGVFDPSIKKKRKVPQVAIAVPLLNCLLLGSL